MTNLGRFLTYEKQKQNTKTPPKRRQAFLGVKMFYYILT